MKIVKDDLAFLSIFKISKQILGIIFLSQFFWYTLFQIFFIWSSYVILPNVLVNPLMWNCYRQFNLSFSSSQNKISVFPQSWLELFLCVCDLRVQIIFAKLVGFCSHSNDEA